MSDFFTRLAERTLGLALTIQPIKPSLFEPEADGAGGMPLEISGEDTADSLLSGELPARMMPSLPTEVTTIPALVRDDETPAARYEYIEAGQPPLPARSAPHQTRYSPAEASATSARSPGKSHLPARYDNLRAPAEKRSTGAAQARGSLPLIRDRDATAHQSGERTSSMTRIYPAGAPMPFTNKEQVTNNTTATGSSPLENAPVVDGGSALERAMELAVMVETAPREQSISHHVLLGEHGRPQSPASRQAAQGQVSAAAPEPAVQVTIGRVEVRAVAPPAGADSARPAARADVPRPMSLDEYLRRQEQGGRR